MIEDEKITVIGGGSWGTAIAKILAEKKQIINHPQSSNVTMWLYEEDFEGTPLIKIINEQHENRKYLPGVELPTNLKATSDIKKCAAESDIIVFCIPEKFIKSTVEQFCGLIAARKPKPMVISLSKGLLEHPKYGLELISQYLAKQLKTHVSVLMGANIASDVALGHIAEATIAGYKEGERLIYRKIFETSNFYIGFSNAPYSVELFGGLKNIVSLAVGVVEGLGYPCNTCVAVLREGLIEMVRFVQFFALEDITALLESCGVADLVASCEKGRNFKCGIAIAHKKSVEEFEREMGGQTLQGVRACNIVNDFLRAKGLQEKFPLFHVTHRILAGSAPCSDILGVIGATSVFELKKPLTRP